MTTDTTEKRATYTFCDDKCHNAIAKMAKKHGLSQGEVIEVLVENIHDVDKLAHALDQRREQKVGARTSIRAIIQRTKGKPDARKAAMKERLAQ